MSSLNGRKVKMIRLHGATHVQGIGQIGPAVDSSSGKILGELSLQIAEGGVYCFTKTIQFFIPYGNIQLVTLESATELVPTKK